MTELSKKDNQILEFIEKQIEQKGFPPSVREICKAVNLNSTATIHSHLKKLEQHGKIVRDSSKNRSIMLVGNDYAQHKNSKYMDVPIIGKITAGIPITAVHDFQGSFPLPMDFARNRDLFMLRVCGDSMINAAILDGDLIIAEKTETASNGEIVVALINNEETTVKTFYKENGHYRLQPENDTMEPIIAKEVSILGKVVGVFRKL